MAYDFNAQEVFDLAIRIEENGAVFYRKAAGLQEGPDKNFLITLARMEDRHKERFEKMRDQISGMEKSQTVFDPGQEQILYLKAMADSHGGEGDPDAAARLTGEETMEEIITTAIGLEKESILFYLGLRDLVPPRLGRDKIDEIIQEEKLHVAQLNGFLKNSGPVPG